MVKNNIAAPRAQIYHQSFLIIIQLSSFAVIPIQAANYVILSYYIIFWQYYINNNMPELVVRTSKITLTLLITTFLLGACYHNNIIYILSILLSTFYLSLISLYVCFAKDGINSHKEMKEYLTSNYELLSLTPYFIFTFCLFSKVLIFHTSYATNTAQLGLLTNFIFVRLFIIAGFRLVDNLNTIKLLDITNFVVMLLAIIFCESINISYNLLFFSFVFLLLISQTIITMKNNPTINYNRAIYLLANLSILSSGIILFFLHQTSKQAATSLFLNFVLYEIVIIVVLIYRLKYRDYYFNKAEFIVSALLCACTAINNLVCIIVPLEQLMLLSNYYTIYMICSFVLRCVLISLLLYRS